MLDTFGLGLTICLGGHLLPDGHHMQELHEQREGTLWGGLVVEQTAATSQGNT